MTRTPILVVVNDLFCGGAQRIIVDIVAKADHKRFAFTVAYFNESKSPDTLNASLLEAGASLVYVGGGSSLKNFSQLLAHIRQTRPALILSFLPYSCVLARVAGFFSGTPSISLQCNLPFTYPRLVRVLDAVTLSLDRVWLGATSGIEATYGGDRVFFSRDTWKSGRRHFTLYAGVDVEHISREAGLSDTTTVRKEFGIFPDASLVVSVARLISWKGHEDLIEAMVMVPDAHVLIVGWGPLEEELKNRAKECGISDRVHFLGHRTDVYRLLGAADCYVQAHQSVGKHSWEGPNLAQMEACAAGVPSVSTAVPRIEELIEDGVTGRLARMDDPVDLARVIREMLSDRESARRMAEAARKRVEERFSVEKMVRTYEQLFELVVSDR